MINNQQKALRVTIARYSNYQNLISLFSTVISVFVLWPMFSLRITGNLSFGKIGNMKFAASLETIAAVCAVASLLIVSILFHLEKKKGDLEAKERLENAREMELKVDEERKKNHERARDEQINLCKKSIINSHRYISLIGIAVLTVMQIGISIDLWGGFGVNDSVKRAGSAFNLQTIVDTIGLSLLLISVFISTYNKINEKTKDENKKSVTIKDNVKFASSIILPIIGLSLSLAGKILLGFDMKIPVNNGQGNFPLALVLRMIGGVVSIFCLVNFSIINELDKPYISNVKSVDSAAAAGIANI